MRHQFLLSPLPSCGARPVFGLQQVWPPRPAWRPQRLARLRPERRLPRAPFLRATAPAWPGRELESGPFLRESWVRASARALTLALAPVSVQEQAWARELPWARPLFARARRLASAF